MNLYLIGGGEISTGETAEIDQRIISTHSTGSRFLFFPTAANDNQNYIAAIHTVYGKHFKIDVITQSDHRTDIIKKLNEAKVIYLGGGKTSILENFIEEKQLLGTLQNLIDHTTIIGMSAGAQLIAATYGEIGRNTIVRQKGWGLINIAVIVHATAESMIKVVALQEFYVLGSNLYGIGEFAALHIKKDSIKKVGKGDIWTLKNEALFFYT